MAGSEYTALGLEVAVGAIDAELRKLWDADEAQTNASLMNLAVYSEKPGALQRNSDVVRDLTREHACRAILIEMDRGGAEPALHSWITAHCHLAHGRKSVCCEQLAFLLVGHTVGRMRNTVFAHLASDLPLVFWWQGELSPIFEERLYRSIDRLIFDSAEWSDPLAGFARIREAAGHTGHAMVLQDLSWTRTYHFRLAVAALFDDLVAQPWPGRDEYFVRFIALLMVLVVQFLESLQTGLAFRTPTLGIRAHPLPRSGRLRDPTMLAE